MEPLTDVWYVLDIQVTVRWRTPLQEEEQFDQGDVPYQRVEHGCDGGEKGKETECKSEREKGINRHRARLREDNMQRKVSTQHRAQEKRR